MFASFQKKYFLSDKGVAGVKRGIFWTTLTNLITMAGMGFLFLVMAGFVEHLASGADLPDALPIVGGLLVFFVLLFASNWQQYYYTYCIFYEECGKQRMEIAERLRKLPLSFFGRRDLADLTETIMGDVQAMEHAYSHVLGELWGAIIASAIVFVASLFFCWQLAIAAFWSVPVAFAVLYLTRGPMTPVFDRVRAEKVKVTEAIQETLDCVREIRATNQEAHYLERLNAVIDAEERETTKGELANGLLVNSAFAILRLGIATTLVTGAAMVASGQVDFLVMFAFLLMVSRIYAPFDQALMLMSELFVAESSAKRMRSIMEEPVARGSEKFEPAGHDVVFDHVAFGYGAGEDGRAGEKVLTDVSFTAKEGEVTALVGPSGGGKGTVVRRMREMLPEIGFSVSATTRAPRPGEVDGREYHFITKEEFERAISEGNVVEYTQYCGNYYGTLKSELEKLDEGKNLILEIEVEGAMNIKRLYPDSVTVFILPPDYETLRSRLVGRGTNAADDIERRMKKALYEFTLVKNYDYAVVNHSGMADCTAEAIASIVESEKHRVSRAPGAVEEMFFLGREESK